LKSWVRLKIYFLTKYELCCMEMIIEKDEDLYEYVVTYLSDDMWIIV